MNTPLDSMTNINEQSDEELEIYDVILPKAIAAKDESKEGVLKKLECED